jgi:hypothetical protein
MHRRNLIFERDAFRVVFLDPSFRGIAAGEYLDVVDIANLLAGVALPNAKREGSGLLKYSLARSTTSLRRFNCHGSALIGGAKYCRNSSSL